MKYLFALMGIMWLGSEASAADSAVVLRDSVGSEKSNGRIYILHKVDPGQTLYAVMRRYGVSVKEIKAANEGMGDNLRSDQVIRVPYTPPKQTRVAAKEERKEERRKEAEEKKAPVAPSTSASAAFGIHRVEQGQTLYSIAVKYGVTLADIRKWNDMTSDNVRLGEDLIVSEKAFVKLQPAATPFPTPTKPVEKVEPAAPAPVMEKPRKSDPAPEVAEASARRMSESGLAEVIDAETSSSKYLALHRTAPIGTLVQVTNEFNQAEIWVKVVGRIPDTGNNRDIIIKLSTRAFEKLSPNSRRFRASISYIAAN